MTHIYVVNHKVYAALDVIARVVCPTFDPVKRQVLESDRYLLLQQEYDTIQSIFEVLAQAGHVNKDKLFPSAWTVERFAAMWSMDDIQRKLKTIIPTTATESVLNMLMPKLPPLPKFSRIPFPFVKK